MMWKAQKYKYKVQNTVTANRYNATKYKWAHVEIQSPCAPTKHLQHYLTYISLPNPAEGAGVIFEDVQCTNSALSFYWRKKAIILGLVVSRDALVERL